MTEIVSTDVAPGLRPLKTKEDFRLAIHTLAGILVPVFVIAGYGTDTVWMYWIGLAFGLLDPILSFSKTQDGIRKVVYGLSALVVAVAIVLNIGDPTYVASLVAAIATAITAFVASFYTPSSSVATVVSRA